MPRGLFAEFPIDEYEARVSKARKLMAENGLDALLLTQEENIRYFAGGPLSDIYKVYHCNLFVLLPAAADAEPVLLCSYAFQGMARNTWFEDRRFWPFDPNASLLELSQSIGLLAEVIRDKKLADATIGIEKDSGLRPGMTIKEWDELRSALPGVTWESSAPVVWGCRKYKSPREIEKHRAACQITCAAFEEAMHAIKPGITEKELARIINTRMFKEGAERRGFLSLTVGPPRGIWCDVMPADVPVERGALVVMDGGCEVAGYCCDMVRTVSVGPPSDNNKEMFDLAYEAQRNVEEALAEGSVIGDIHDISRRAFEDAGLAAYMSSGGYGQLGHGIGLSIHELPDLCRGSREKFEKGMIFSIEPAVSDHPDRGQATQLFIVENNFAITENGVERLTPLDDQLLIV